MFRATKKKPRNVIRASTEQEDESDKNDESSTGDRDATVVVRRKKKKKKKTGMVIRSFGEDDDEDDTNSRIRKRRRKGPGFGGSMIVLDHAEEQTDKGSVSDSKNPTYGREALNQLKAEQKVKPEKKNKNVTSQSDEANDLTKEKAAPEDTPSLPFIPLDSEQELVLTGQEAIDMQEHTPNEFLATVDLKENSVRGTEASAWEEQITRRAGLQVPKNSKSNSSSMLPSLASLRQQLQSTYENLEKQQLDLENAMMRREADLNRTEADWKRHKQTLSGAGDACNDYQELRHCLAMWVGALRDLAKKVEPIMETVKQMIQSQYAIMQKEWIDWQDDVVSTLREAGGLVQVVGREPDLPDIDGISSTVDEFGRDVQSQYLRERGKRHRNRMERKGNGLPGILASLWVEDRDQFQRYTSLQEALRVALDDLEQEYTSMAKVVGVFVNWKQSYLEEYQQCYANISLGELASVLVQVEICRSSWALQMLHYDHQQRNTTEGELTQLPSLNELLPTNEEDLTEQEGAIQKVLQTCFLPLLGDLLNEAPALFFLSSDKSSLLKKIAEQIEKYSRKNSKVYNEAEDAVLKAITTVLGQVSIPILDPGFNKDSNGDEQKAHAVEFADMNQVIWIQQMLLNIFRDWVPFFRERNHDVGRILLDFISSKYLFLLSSLSPSRASGLFLPIWKVLNDENSDWFETFLIESAPIRAAATAYGFS